MCNKIPFRPVAGDRDLDHMAPYVKVPNLFLFLLLLSCKKRSPSTEHLYEYYVK